MGKEQGATGQTDCEFCGLGFFNDVSGTPNCADCPGNFYSRVTGATACESCLRNFYYSLDGDCNICPEGTSCPLDGESTQQDLIVLAGWWRIAGVTPVVHPCPYAAGCVGAEKNPFPTSRRLREGSDGYCEFDFVGNSRMRFGSI